MELQKPNRVVAPPFTEDMVRALMKHLQITTLPGSLTGLESRLLNDAYDIMNRELIPDHRQNSTKIRKKRFRP